ncbi:thiosulfate dehydrogenase [quinone] large subunit [Micromonospora nigra]|uniref:Thiosulfate dehydrogenase [quinone] large subunit n=1 Tax=Micromonospora nigra TaxID=145857 RepID=A0A1C6T0S9_9ACTN|nr:thiosulfate dehydrogenase [quinone] large subunit [Micromonospora nigra]
MTATTERTPAATITPAADTPRERATRYLFAGLRLALGWVFLWAFLDKVFGLGFATETKNAWINGGSPTRGFLTHGTAGPFKDFYAGMAGAAWADWLFMIGLAAIGTALMLGIGVRVAAAAGGLMLVMMWTAALPPTNNPFMDDHLVYAAVLAVLALVNAGDTWGLGRAWAKLDIVQRNGWLR